MIRSKSATRTVRLSEIGTDPNVNREIDQAWVNYLIKNWDQSLMGIPDVAANNGNYIVIDGQHRLAALAEQHADDPRVSVTVHEGLTRPEMARMFVELNKTRGVRAFDKFKKLVFSGDPDAVRIEGVLASYGLHLDLAPNEGAVGCVIALQKVYRLDVSTANILTRVFGILTKAWGKEPANFQGDIVAGTGLLIHRYPDLQDKALANVLAKAPGGPSGLIGKARTIREIQGGAIAGGVAEAERNLYNRGRRTRRLDA